MEFKDPTSDLLGMWVTLLDNMFWVLFVKFITKFILEGDNK